MTPELTLMVPPPTFTGEQISVAMQLKSTDAPIGGASLTLSMNGQKHALQTDGQGIAVYNLNRVPPGTYPVTGSYAGDSVHRILPASASGQVTVLPRIGAAITISLPPATLTGQEAPISALLSAGGVALDGERLSLSIDAVHKGELITDASGVVNYRLSRGLAPGAHAIALSYNGNPKAGIGRATASGKISILPPIKTWVVLSLPQPTKAGQKATLTATLESNLGTVRRHALHISIDGKAKLGLLTDDSGNAHLDVSRSTPAGVYFVQAEFKGERPTGLSPSSSQGVMTILPISLTVQTVPALPGTVVRVDGLAVQANADGLATVPVGSTGDHNISLDAPEIGPGARTQFARWSDGATTSSRPLRMLGDAHLYAGFSGDFLTKLSFIDGNGAPVDTARLTGVALNGPEGATIALRSPFDPLWLHVPAPSRAVLDGVRTIWKFSVASGSYQGVSVINRGDDPYLPHASGNWLIKLRIYSLKVHTRRPLIGNGIPSQVAVARQDRFPLTVPLDSSGNATLLSLPRGSYTVRIPHTNLAAEFTLSLTRSQEVTIPLVSTLEIAAALGLLALFVGAITLLPRRRRLIRLMRRETQRIRTSRHGTTVPNDLSGMP